MNKLACELRLRREVAAWSDKILDDAVEFAKTHQPIFVGRYPVVGNSQLYGLMNLVQNTSNFGKVRYFTNHQARKAAARGSADRYKDAEEFWLTVGKKLNELSIAARSLTDESGFSDLPKADCPEIDDLHRTLAVEYLQHLTAEVLFISQQEAEHQRQPRRGNQPPRNRRNSTTNRR